MRLEDEKAKRKIQKRGADQWQHAEQRVAEANPRSIASRFAKSKLLASSPMMWLSAKVCVMIGGVHRQEQQRQQKQAQLLNAENGAARQGE